MASASGKVSAQGWGQGGDEEGEPALPTAWPSTAPVSCRKEQRPCLALQRGSGFPRALRNGPASLSSGGEMHKNFEAGG